MSRRKAASDRLARGRVKAAANRTRQEMATAMESYARTMNVRGAMRAGCEVVTKKVRKSDKLKMQVVVRHPKAKGAGAYQSVGPRVRLNIAFAQDVGMRSLARRYDMHHSSIMRNMLGVAEVFTNHQAEYMEALVAMSKKLPPAVVVSSRKWDETKQKNVALPTVEDAEHAAEQDPHRKK